MTDFGPKEAAQALSDIEQMVARVRQSRTYDIASLTMILWGVLVVVEAEHLCMSMRGVRKPGAVTVTSAVRGHFLTSPAARAEVLGFVQRQSGA